MIEGISHITFIVRDLALAAEFFTSIFQAREVYSSGDRPFSLSRERFFMIGDVWICAMEGEPLTERTYNHLSFKISEEDFDVYIRRIKAIGVDIKPERPRVRGEGRSIYFYDFDNHLFELHTGTLEERLKTYSLK